MSVCNEIISPTDSVLPYGETHTLLKNEHGESEVTGLPKSWVPVQVRTTDAQIYLHLTLNDSLTRVVEVNLQSKQAWVTGHFQG